MNKPRDDISDWVSVFKNDVIHELLGCQNIITLLNSDKEDEDLIYNNIYPCIQYGFITQQTQEAYIGMGLQLDQIYPDEHDVYANFYFDFVIMVNNGVIKTEWGGIRPDLLAGEIIKLFNHKVKLGFEWLMVSRSEGAYNDKFYEVDLRFRAKVMNSYENGMKINRVR